MILETTFVSHLMKGNDGAFEKAQELHEKGETQWITPVVLFELYYGAYMAEDEELVRLVSNVARMFEIAYMKEEESEHGARLLAQADLAEGGNCGVERPDAMIAGVASQLGETVITENVEDFRKLRSDIEEFTS